VGQNLAERDQIDTNRNESPLVQADDAIYFDNSNFTRESQLEWALSLVRKRLNQ
jgi:cytidylate kinase